MSGLDDLPKECVFCGSTKIGNVVIGVDLEENIRRNRICDECIRLHMFSLAGRDRDKFDEFVRDAREVKSKQQ